MSKLVNVVGGVFGGWGFTQLWATHAQLGPVEVAASAVGAYVGAVLLGDLLGLARTRRG